MLFLTMWGGGLAHAAERSICLPVASEAAGHFMGDGDEVPADDRQDVAHHHTGCSGHQVAASAGEPTSVSLHKSVSVPPIRSAAGLQGRDPDRQLRPPIA